jgi:hypothetical protein
VVFGRLVDKEGKDACTLAQCACRQGHSALYLRVPRLAEELRILHGAGSFRRWLQQLAKADVLVLDDWGNSAARQRQERRHPVRARRRDAQEQDDQHGAHRVLRDDLERVFG